MTKEEAIRRAGSRNALARILGITGSAISQWGDNVPGPVLKRLRRMCPLWFK